MRFRRLRTVRGQGVPLRQVSCYAEPRPGGETTLRVIAIRAIAWTTDKQRTAVAAVRSPGQNVRKNGGRQMRYPNIPGFSVRPIEPADAPAWADYICLPDVRRHTSSTAATVADVLHDIEKALADERRISVRFVIETLEARQLVGTVGFHTISELHGTAEISYDIAPHHRGKGIATAACRAATSWGFEARGWHRVQGTTVLANLASQRVLERSGFQREGLMRNFRMVQGRSADYWLYSAIPGESASAR